MLTGDRLKGLADEINPDSDLGFEDGQVPTDVFLIVRARNPARLGESWLTTVATPETDYVTLAGMLRWAEAINDGRGDH